MNIEQLKEIKKRVKEAFKDVKGIAGFGIGDNRIRIYVLNESVELPVEFEGVPLEPVVTGEIRCLENVKPAPFTYTNLQTPERYGCAKCEAKGVKLWRQWNTFLEHIELLCVDCAIKDQCKEITVNEDGRHETYMGMTDQIGNLVPAVPDLENETFWGYTSVPEAGVQWWKHLPLRAEPV